MPRVAVEDSGSLLSFKLSDLSPLRYSDFVDFVAYLGVATEGADPSCPAMVAAHQAFAAPLPPNWSEQVEQDRIYFYNSATDESSWAHPQESTFREILQEVRRWSPDTPTEAVVSTIDTHLRDFREQAAASLEAWSGPYTALATENFPELTAEGGPEAEYYFNAYTRESCWEHPCMVWEYELYTRYLILYKCLVAHDRMRMGPAAASDESSSEADSEAWQQSRGFGGVTALAQSFLSSLRLPRPQPGAVAPARSPPRAMSPPRGPDPSLSMRSDVSSAYLTARSETADSE